MVAVPEKRVPVFSKGMFATRATGALIVETGNYYPSRPRAGNMVPIRARIG